MGGVVFKLGFHESVGKEIEDQRNIEWCQYRDKVRLCCNDKIGREISTPVLNLRRRIPNTGKLMGIMFIMAETIEKLTHP